MKKSDYNPVVILELMFAGYGVARSLSPYDMTVIGFSSGRFLPPTYSRFVDRLVFFKDHTELLEKLEQVALDYEKKPVLILTGDTYVNFAARHIEVLRSLFLIDFPDQATVDLLLNKTVFSDFAKKHDFLIPQTEVISQAAELKDLEERLFFPVIIKPYQKTKAWQEAKFPKGFMANHFEELKEVYAKIQPVESHVIVQEWVPGEDHNIAFCLVYYNNNYQCVTQFTGAKVKQWPVGKGSTSIACPLKDDWVTKESLKLFDMIAFTGLGSIEYKKHDFNGKYYIIEPTVGRVNAQEFVATVNGVNIPLAVYKSLTNIAIEPKEKNERSVTFVHEISEISRIKNALANRTLKFNDLFRWPAKAPRVYAYSTFKDPKVGLTVFLHLLGKLFRLSK